MFFIHELFLCRRINNLCSIQEDDWVQEDDWAVIAYLQRSRNNVSCVTGPTFFSSKAGSINPNVL